MTARGSRRRALCLLAVGLVIGSGRGFFLTASEAGPSAPPTGTETTNSFPRDKTRGKFTAINWHSVSDRQGRPMQLGGVVGVDITLPTANWRYRPCSNADDPFNGACLNPGNPGSYIYAKNFLAGGGTNFPRGLFISNSSTRASCAAPCEHFWGQRVGRVDIEMSTKNADGVTNPTYVRNRFAQVSGHFRNHANGGTYGPAVGTIRILKLGDPTVVRLSGIIKRAALRASRDAEVRMFQDDARARSTGGQPLQSFATVGVGDTGFYSSGALYAGYYTIRVVDRVTGTCKRRKGVNLLVAGRLDFDLTKPDFGQGFTLPC